MGSTYRVVAESEESTVVTEYVPEKKRSEEYQSEAALEARFISMLVEQGYERVNITREPDLISNLRKQIETLNDYTFSDSEWDGFFNKYIANANEGIKEKTRTIQEDYIKNLEKEDGTTVNISLINKKDIHKNHLQVLNQYEVSQEEGAKYDNRYDVTILVNGLPLVHIELKRRGVDIKEAFNQINRYQRDSFWAGSGLFEYVQIFVISNGTFTKYYSNTTRDSHVKEQNPKARNKSKKTSNSFEFTSFWADSKNHTIPDLIDFTKTFFAKHTILNILTKYCVFTTEKILMVMRPYQITATEKIINRIKIGYNYKKYGTIDAGGYIWHTTGSGKTLTSFKTAMLATDLPYIKKVLFVVDRKDLDYQTMTEYDRFQKGAADSSTSTSKLKKQLENPGAKIIITTIQKLSIFIKKNKGHEIFKEPIVIIFDECHRSQFGDMHESITKSFSKYFLFGFTGTPIFPENAPKGNKYKLRTTEQAFGEKLHTYTIVNAITDGNVLPFRIGYASTMDLNAYMKDSEVRDIDREAALLAPKRIRDITGYVLDHFNQQTKRNEKAYSYNVLTNVEEVATQKKKPVEEKREKKNISGFNTIFAADSIEAAKLYYTEFKKQIDEKGLPFKVATIFSYAANEEVDETSLDEENSDDTEGLDQSSRDFLEAAIKDYNGMFTCNYDTSKEKFPAYYKDVSLRMKNREIDILIVVNMFLTGFDATTLNTLWVDKNLRMHGLIQAFSRTNRILNSVKTFGNIVCFRNLEKETNAAIGKFSDGEASGFVLLKNFNCYYYGFDEEDGHGKKKHHRGYVEVIDNLLQEYPIEKQIIGEENEKKFIRLFSLLLSLRNILSSFEEFEEKDILAEGDFQNYTSIYLNLYEKYRRTKKADKTNVNDDIVFEIELVKQVEVNIDYILSLVKKYHETNCEDKEIVAAINRAVESSPQLRSKRALIQEFVDRMSGGTMDEDGWYDFVLTRLHDDINQLIIDENLKPQETEKYIRNMFRDEVVKSTGTDLEKILPPVSRFGSSKRDDKIARVMERMQKLYDEYADIVPYEDVGGKLVLSETKIEAPTLVMKKSYEIDEKNLFMLFKKDHSFAKTLFAGDYIYTEDGMVCFFDWNYIDKEEGLRARLTAYAKAHLGECCMSFGFDKGNNALSATVPKRKIEKVRANDANVQHFMTGITAETSEDIRTLSKVSAKTLQAMPRHDYGESCVFLMNLCNMTIDGLETITGMNRNTISNMRNGSNITVKNTVRASLGMNLTPQVSNAFLNSGRIYLRDENEEDLTYMYILSTFWNKPYAVTTEKLHEQHLESYIIGR